MLVCNYDDINQVNQTSYVLLNSYHKWLTFASYIMQVTNYLQEIAPDLCDRVELYSKSTPLFDEYKIEEEIDNILSKR